MTNTNDNRFFKKDGKTVNKKYIAKKHSKEKQQKLFNKWYVIFLILISLAIIAYNIYAHSFFKISEVYIRGNNYVDDTTIVGQMGNPIDKNILLYNPDEFIDQIEEIPYIDHVVIQKVFPNLLNVKIDENYPLFFQNDGESRVYISNNGKLLGEDLADLDDGLIEIVGSNLRQTVGENFTSSDASLKFIEAIQGFSYFSGLKQLNLENKADIGIMINDIDVRFGDLNNIDYKLKLLDNILNDINNKGIAVNEIDLDNGKSPVVKVDSESFSENLNN